MALRAFRRALCHVTKSGEVWCEGARIFLDPCCRAFNLLNASKCLNYAVFFTPQYGDTFIEAIKLLILSSDRFLEFHACPNPCLLSYLLRSMPQIVLFIKRASFFEPNYGFLWFRAQPFMQSPLKEVLYTCLLTISREIALNAALYYEAMQYSLRRSQQRARREAASKSVPADRAKSQGNQAAGSDGAAVSKSDGAAVLKSDGAAVSKSDEQRGGGKDVNVESDVNPAISAVASIPASAPIAESPSGSVENAENVKNMSRAASHRVISTAYKPSFLLQHVPSAEKLLFNLKLLYGARQMDL